MTTQHTQGPWEARWSERGGYWFIDHEQGGEGYTLTKLDCKESDANLIAAAPELLDALLSIAEHDREFADLEDAETMVARMTEKARAAIARATGEAQ